jgi:hypothetical protein
MIVDDVVVPLDPTGLTYGAGSVVPAEVRMTANANTPRSTNAATPAANATGSRSCQLGSSTGRPPSPLTGGS